MKKCNQLIHRWTVCALACVLIHIKYAIKFKYVEFYLFH